MRVGAGNRVTINIAFHIRCKVSWTPAQQRTARAVHCVRGTDALRVPDAVRRLFALLRRAGTIQMPSNILAGGYDREVA
jgi:hypothetical protein